MAPAMEQVPIPQTIALVVGLRLKTIQLSVNSMCSGSFATWGYIFVPAMMLRLFFRGTTNVQTNAR